jgi:hypothetical protein
VIRSNTYVSTISYLLELTRIAVKDFEEFGLKYEDIQVKHYGGQRYKSTFGIEFRPNEAVKNDTYIDIDGLEATL